MIKQRGIQRSRSEAMIAGVCAGIANYLNTDPAFVRVTALICALFMPKVTVALYLVAWLVLDDERKI